MQKLVYKCQSIIIIHNSQKAEAIPMSINIGTNIMNIMWLIHIMEYHTVIHKKKRSTDTCYHMDES